MPRVHSSNHLFDMSIVLKTMSCQTRKFQTLLIGWLAALQKRSALPDFVNACAWVCALQVNAYRESVIAKIEQTANSLRQQGACNEWFAGADPKICAAATEVNGPLMATLAKSIRYVHAPSFMVVLVLLGASVASFEVSRCGMCGYVPSWWRPSWHIVSLRKWCAS